MALYSAPIYWRYRYTHTHTDTEEERSSPPLTDRLISFFPISLDDDDNGYRVIHNRVAWAPFSVTPWNSFCCIIYSTANGKTIRNPLKCDEEDASFNGGGDPFCAMIHRALFLCAARRRDIDPSIPSVITTLDLFSLQRKFTKLLEDTSTPLCYLWLGKRSITNCPSQLFWEKKKKKAEVSFIFFIKRFFWRMNQVFCLGGGGGE